MKGKVLIVIFVLSALFSLKAETYIEFAEDFEGVLNIGRSVEFLEDSSQELTIDDVVKSSEFVKQHSVIFIRPASEATLWIKIPYRNKSEKVVWLETGHSFSVWELDYYYADSSGLTNDGEPLYELGSLRSSSNKLLASKYYCVPLPPSINNGIDTVYLRVEGMFPMTLTLQAYSEKHINSKAHNDVMIFSLFIGVIVAILLYNLFLFFSTRELTYLFYVIYLGSMGLLIPFAEGNAMFDFPLFYEKITVVQSIQILANTFFVTEYFSLRRNYKKLYYSIWGGTSLLFFVLPVINLFNWLDYLIIINMFQVLGPLFYVFILVLATYFLVKKYNGALFFVVGWSVLFSSVILFYLSINGFLPYNNLTANFPYIGVSIECLVFAFALGNRINKLKDENVKINKEKLEIVQKQNQVLDETVRKRTKELDDQLKKSNDLNKELLRTNEELSEKNHVIYNQKEELETTMQNLKDAQSQLVQSEKMASLGILTAGIAHEINNPLNFISGAQQILKHLQKEETAFLSNADFDMCVNHISEGLIRCQKIMKSLRQFNENHDGFTGRCTVSEIIDNCLVMLNNKLKNRVSVKIEYALNGNEIVRGNVGQLHQVFLNVLSNAAQAIEGKGTITIATVVDDEILNIYITDTGGGIKKEHLKSIIDPFFTTKDPGKGVGLGLSIVYNIIKDHKGEITFESEEGKGTTVIVTLPLYK